MLKKQTLTEPNIEEVKKDIQQVNERFYEAICTGNIEIMEDIWAKTDDVKCIHPICPIIMGWEKIRESWQKIFNSDELTNIEVSNIHIDIKDDSAWLNCVEKINYVVKDQMILTVAQTTNIFEMNEQKWNLVLHHSSLMPIPPSEFLNEQLQ